MTTSDELRKIFLEFFENKNHKIIPSSSLAPDDPSLLFTSAGMVPFKPYFLGLKRGIKRAVSCQKCFRTTDIDEVGHTARHLTFFEMLGNFSFGDYFKEESLLWGWEFLTKKLWLDEKRLYITVYGGGKALEDKESYKIWHKILPKELHSHIKKLGDKDNFWQMAETGPCGPCSEIYYDFTQKPLHENCKGVGCDCDRFIEIWNHVFTEFDIQTDGSLKTLPRKNIDTGMGLERLAAVVQNKKTPFETDLFIPIIKKAEQITKLNYENPEHKTALRIIADHIRSCVFLISEGILPANEGRGYVLRRLIRRGVRFGHLFGYKKQFLSELIKPVVKVFENTYNDIAHNYEQIKETISNEEQRFSKTLSIGDKYLKDLIEKSPKHINGKDAFFIYETYGFPLELIKEISREKGSTVDEIGFEKAKKQAQITARSKWKGSGKKDTFKFQPLDKKFNETKFTGYDKLEIETDIVAFVDENGKIISQVKPGQSCYLILKETPFYAESGGQIADSGFIEDRDRNILAEVIDTQKFTEKLIFHKVIIKSPKIDSLLVKAVVDAKKRKKITQNHTATHLLNAALKQVLGNQTRQAGSYVSDKGLRFDYTTNKIPTEKDFEKLGEFIKKAISQNLKVQVKELPLAKAKELGAVTLLGENYSDPARFVLINEKGWENPTPRLSLELCGGTHVKSTGEIKGIKISKDSALSSGVRRIEALAGESMTDYFKKTSEIAQEISRKLKVSVDDLPKRIEQLITHEKKLKDEINTLRQKLLSGSAQGIKMHKLFDQIRLLWSKTENTDISLLRNEADNLRARNKNAVIFLVSEKDKRMAFVLTVGENAKSKNLDCVKISKEIAKKVNGSAGGRQDFAQGGGTLPENFDDFILQTVRIIRSFSK